jgi:hypothetical protein
MADNITDTKPRACGGVFLRRTDENVLSRSTPQVTRSGDRHARFPLFNLQENQTQDSDPRWGKECEEET